MFIKSSWESEMEADREERKRSVLYALSNQEEIEKSLVSELKSSGSDLSKITKKGSEIKEKLQDHKIMYGSKLLYLEKRCAEIKESLNIAPEKEIEDSKSKYSYNQISSNEELSDSMREYNRCVYECNTVKKEIGFLNIIISNIKENKDYVLNPSLASEIF